MTKHNGYRKHYLSIDKTFPSVLALKMFMGNNPELKFEKSYLENKNICEIGFGDGRDLNLFDYLGMNVTGIEPDGSVVEYTKQKLSKNEMKVNVQVGSNMNTNLENQSQDFVYASASIYYLPSSEFTIMDALSEAHRILKRGGYFLASFARSDSHVTRDAVKVDKNTLILEDPFYKFRKGQRYHVYNTQDELKSDLVETGFSNIYIGDYDVDWFGTRETLFLCVCNK